MLASLKYEKKFSFFNNKEISLFLGLFVSLFNLNKENKQFLFHFVINTFIETKSEIFLTQTSFSIQTTIKKSD
jgi:hypothetical protein